jgi:hypothetical protein
VSRQPIHRHQFRTLLGDLPGAQAAWGSVLEEEKERKLSFLLAKGDLVDVVYLLPGEMPPEALFAEDSDLSKSHPHVVVKRASPSAVKFIRPNPSEAAPEPEARPSPTIHGTSWAFTPYPPKPEATEKAPERVNEPSGDAMRLFVTDLQDGRVQFEAVGVNALQIRALSGAIRSAFEILKDVSEAKDEGSPEFTVNAHPPRPWDAGPHAFVSRATFDALTAAARQQSEPTARRNPDSVQEALDDDDEERIDWEAAIDNDVMDACDALKDAVMGAYRLFIGVRTEANRKRFKLLSLRLSELVSCLRLSPEEAELEKAGF